MLNLGCQHPQDVRKKGSKILKKLPSVRQLFKLAMTNKLVVIINSLKVPKTKTILLYEMKFLVPNYSCLQNPWLGGYRPQIPFLSVLCPQLNLLNPPEQNSSVRHCCLSKAIHANRKCLHIRHSCYLTSPQWSKSASSCTVSTRHALQIAVNVCLAPHKQFPILLQVPTILTCKAERRHFTMWR